MDKIEKYLNKFYNFIDKIGKHNFILIVFIFFVLLVTGLYQTFSLYTESEGLSILNGIDTYSFILNASNQTNSVTIAAGTSKSVDITVKNDSVIPLKYGIYSYEESNPNENFVFGYSTVTTNPAKGIIPAKTDYVVTLKVYNYSQNSKTLSFGIKYGFENNKELDLDSDLYWIEPLNLMKPLFKTWDGDYNYYRANAYRDNIVSASFVDLDTISSDVSIENAVMSWNISATNSNDDSVKAWVMRNETNEEYYDLYIGASGKIYVESMYGLFSQMSALETIDFSNLDTTLTTDMSFLFGECYNLSANYQTLDLTKFNTSNVIKFDYMFYYCTNILTTLIISNNSFGVPTYTSMLTEAATADNAKILLYYVNGTEILVNNMSGTKSETSNIEIDLFGAQLLNEMSVGSYVKYVGNNGCSNTNTVNGYTSCLGKNANYVNDTNMGYCNNSSYKFNSNGWRIAYVNDSSVHLISAGATDCLCTNSNETTSNSSCSTYFEGDKFYIHLNNLNNTALKYCNKDYSKDGVCDNTTAWAMNALDFEKITGKTLKSSSCYQASGDTTCGYNNSLIDNGGFYWFATVHDTISRGAFFWWAYDRYVSVYNSSFVSGIRPVLALDPSIVVVAGTGSYTDPYIITK